MYHQQPPATRVLSTAQTMRLFSLVLMMAVIGLTIYRAGPWRQENLQAVAAPAEEQAPAPPAPNPAPERPASKAPPSVADNAPPAGQPADDTDDNTLSEPPAVAGEPADGELKLSDESGGDDRSADEKSAFRWETQGIADQSTLIQGFELPAYRRLFKWISSQSVSDLAARQPPDAVFQQLKQHPEKYRGELLTLELTIRRVEKDPASAGNLAGAERVYQLWGWPLSGRGWLYDVVVPELPPGFPEGPDVYQNVRVYGYFFKLQGYQPANAKPNARPLVAPLIVGKLAWEPSTPTANPAEQALSLVILVAGGLILLAAIGYWVVSARRKKKPVAPRSAEVDWPADREEEPYSEYEEQEDSERDEPPRGRRDNFDWLKEE